jgi:hypothetical protein
MDERPRQPDESQPGDFKTACDGGGGLVRVRLVGPPHEGRSLYIDELDLPAVIYTTSPPSRFEWWAERIHERMRTMRAGSDPDAPPVRHTLHIDPDTSEPTYRPEAISAT